MTQKGVYKERLLQIVSVATQVAISRRVQRYKIGLRGRQEVEDQRTRSTSNTSTQTFVESYLDSPRRAQTPPCMISGRDVSGNVFWRGERHHSSRDGSWSLRPF